VYHTLVFYKISANESKIDLLAEVKKYFLPNLSRKY